MIVITAELWRQTESSFALYIDTVHEREIRNIKRSRDWDITATYQKNGNLIGIQWRVPELDYRIAKRIENRINKSVHEIKDTTILNTS
ncbi:hypothetical protein [Lysinibacillus xylanilyticus]|uniref:DUF2283 domain-containing protein n=1 Tax=Lysinibacillus xylanilyticus TaxID=582475 RepID=A0ABT4EYP2_9BACI|nr:hypothetical protein [Lysinibacillus xylanilyticus]MCY9549406.1 hypothetical protein [Lysinibacillus xylanilyticus]